MRTFLKTFLILLLLWMIYVVVSTSLKSNLFTEWDYLGAIPWMQATLWDFYANILIIYLWILYKEKNTGIRILWAVLLFCLGSIASIIYVLIQLFRLKDEEPLENLLLKK